MYCQCLTHFGQPFEQVTRPDLVPTGTEVVLKVTAAGLCHSDLHNLSGAYDLGRGEKLYFADRGLHLPKVLGHEIAGRVVAAGPDVPEIDRSRNYVIYPWQGCRRCAQCARGYENLCLTPKNLGFHVDGGFASMIKIPHPRYLFDIGDLDPSFAATLACSGLTSFSALKKVQVTIGETPLVIIGGGGLGLMCVGLLKAIGGRPAVVVDVDAAKREAALKAGAGAAIDARAADVADQIRAAVGGPVPAIIDFVASESTARLAMDIIVKGGKLIVVGLFGGATPWSLPVIPLRAVSIIGSVVGSYPEFEELVRLAVEGKVVPLQTQTMPLAQLNEAAHRLEQGQVIGRLVMQP